MESDKSLSSSSVNSVSGQPDSKILLPRVALPKPDEKELKRDLLNESMCQLLVFGESLTRLPLLSDCKNNLKILASIHSISNTILQKSQEINFKFIEEMLVLIINYSNIPGFTDIGITLNKYVILYADKVPLLDMPLIHLILKAQTHFPLFKLYSYRNLKPDQYLRKFCQLIKNICVIDWDISCINQLIKLGQQCLNHPNISALPDVKQFISKLMPLIEKYLIENISISISVNADALKARDYADVKRIGLNLKKYLTDGDLDQNEDKTKLDQSNQEKFLKIISLQNKIIEGSSQGGLSSSELEKIASKCLQLTALYHSFDTPAEQLYIEYANSLYECINKPSWEWISALYLGYKMIPDQLKKFLYLEKAARLLPQITEPCLDLMFAGEFYDKVGESYELKREFKQACKFYQLAISQDKHSNTHQKITAKLKISRVLYMSYVQPPHDSKALVSSQLLLSECMLLAASTTDMPVNWKILLNNYLENLSQAAKILRKLFMPARKSLPDLLLEDAYDLSKPLSFKTENQLRAAVISYLNTQIHVFNWKSFASGIFFNDFDSNEISQLAAKFNQMPDVMLSEFWLNFVLAMLVIKKDPVNYTLLVQTLYNLYNLLALNPFKKVQCLSLLHLAVASYYLNFERSNRLDSHIIQVLTSLYEYYGREGDWEKVVDYPVKLEAIYLSQQITEVLIGSLEKAETFLRNCFRRTGNPIFSAANAVLTQYLSAPEDKAATPVLPISKVISLVSGDSLTEHPKIDQSSAAQKKKKVRNKQKHNDQSVSLKLLPPSSSSLIVSNPIAAADSPQQQNADHKEDNLFQVISLQEAKLPALELSAGKINLPLQGFSEKIEINPDLQLLTEKFQQSQNDLDASRSEIERLNKAKIQNQESVLKLEQKIVEMTKKLSTLKAEKFALNGKWVKLESSHQQQESQLTILKHQKKKLEEVVKNLTQEKELQFQRLYSQQEKMTQLTAQLKSTQDKLKEQQLINVTLNEKLDNEFSKNLGPKAESLAKQSSLNKKAGLLQQEFKQQHLKVDNNLSSSKVFPKTACAPSEASLPPRTIIDPNDPIAKLEKEKHEFEIEKQKLKHEKQALEEEKKAVQQKKYELNKEKQAAQKEKQDVLKTAQELRDQKQELQTKNADLYDQLVNAQHNESKLKAELIEKTGKLMLESSQLQLARDHIRELNKSSSKHTQGGSISSMNAPDDISLQQDALVPDAVSEEKLEDLLKIKEKQISSLTNSRDWYKMKLDNLVVGSFHSQRPDLPYSSAQNFLPPPSVYQNGLPFAYSLPHHPGMFAVYPPPPVIGSMPRPILAGFKPGPTHSQPAGEHLSPPYSSRAIVHSAEIKEQKDLSNSSSSPIPISNPTQNASPRFMSHRRTSSSSLNRKGLNMNQGSPQASVKPNPT